MKKAKWENTKVGEVKKETKKRKKYMTKARKKERAKNVFLLVIVVLTLTALNGYASIDENEIRLNLKAKAESGIRLHNEIENAREVANIQPKGDLGFDSVMQNEVMTLIKESGLNMYEAYAIIQCESSWDPDAHGVNWNNKAGVDRGLFQISSLYHPEVSNACAYDPICNTKEAIRIHNEWNGWGAWSCGKLLGFN